MNTSIFIICLVYDCYGSKDIIFKLKNVLSSQQVVLLMEKTLQDLLPPSGKDLIIQVSPIGELSFVLSSKLYDDYKKMSSLDRLYMLFEMFNDLAYSFVEKITYKLLNEIPLGNIACFLSHDNSDVRNMVKLFIAQKEK